MEPGIHEAAVAHHHDLNNSEDNQNDEILQLQTGIKSKSRKLLGLLDAKCQQLILRSERSWRKYGDRMVKGAEQSTGFRQSSRLENTRRTAQLTAKREEHDAIIDKLKELRNTVEQLMTEVDALFVDQDETDNDSSIERTSNSSQASDNITSANDSSSGADAPENSNSEDAVRKRTIKELELRLAIEKKKAEVSRLLEILNTAPKRRGETGSLSK